MPFSRSRNSRLRHHFMKQLYRRISPDVHIFLGRFWHIGTSMYTYMYRNLETFIPLRQNHSVRHSRFDAPDVGSIVFPVPMRKMHLYRPLPFRRRPRRTNYHQPFVHDSGIWLRRIRLYFVVGVSRMPSTLIFHAIIFLIYRLSNVNRNNVRIFNLLVFDLGSLGPSTVTLIALL